MVELTRALAHVTVGAIAFFLGAFEKCGEVSMSFVISVRPSTWNNSVPTGRIFTKIDI
jgi:hypothetical protein